MSPWLPRILALVIASASLPGAALAQTPPPPPSPSRIPDDVRLFQRFIEDGAVTDGFRFEGQFRFQSFDHADVYYLEPTFAANVAEDIEIGGRIRLATVNPDPGGTDTGLTDLDIYGKIRLSTAPTQWSIGALLKLPTGDQKKSLFLGTGEADVAFFMGVRQDFRNLSLVGNASLRLNQDPDLDVHPALEGEMSAALGGAVIFPFTKNVYGIGELSFETERINHAGSDFRTTFGVDWQRPEGVGARFGASVGNGGSAPNFELIASALFLF